MYIDILPNDNLPEPAMATFTITGPAIAVRTVRLWREDRWAWCAITGWSESGPVPAWFHPIEESGDGPARLLTGGEHGLRLAEIPGPDAADPAWDLGDGSQWAEPFLITTPEAEFRPSV
jgi:hypothetical protein